MSASHDRPAGVISREDYLRWYEAQPRGRFERIDGRIVAMAPEQAAHVRVKTNIWLALRGAVAAAGVACEAWADGLTVRTGDNDFEPDALVNCGAPLPDNAVGATNPVVIVEVLSPSTASADTGNKLVGYFQLPSVSHYLIVHPLKRVVIHHWRTGGDIRTMIVQQGAIALEPPGITITMEEIYGPAVAS